jgi:hypothetical protein
MPNEPASQTQGSESNMQTALRKEYQDYLWDLFWRAHGKGSFDFVLTLLRFDGMSFGMWDPMVEADEALADFSEMIREAAKDETKVKRLKRLNLLIYCHATEMSAPYEILYNVLRCANGEKYRMRPFSHLATPKSKKKKGLFRKFLPPSPKRKIGALREMCNSMREPKLIEIFDAFFREDIRNAFYHSDYCIDLEDRCFNITEVQFGKRIPFDELNEVLTKAFAFYEAFFRAYYGMRMAIRKARRFYRWPQYEVLELLSNEDEGLYGFTVHISNGTQCTFERHKDRVIAQNVMFEDEGLSLQVGLLDDLREEGLIRGEPYREPMDRDRYNQNGEWKPIVYPASTDRIQAEIQTLTQDPRVRGSLFYVRCTGQRAIEFFAKGALGTDTPEHVCADGLRLYRCDWLIHEEKGSKIYVYDGTMPLKDGSLESVLAGLQGIDATLRSLGSQRNAQFVWDVKYKTVTEGGQRTENEDGTISLALDFSDPRSLLVLSHERMLPTNDWKMKLEWMK